MTLKQLQIGQLATINLLDGNNSVARLCRVLGLIPGAPVKVLHRTRGQGPMQVKSMGTLYAIRADDADQIHVVIA